MLSPATIQSHTQQFPAFSALDAKTLDIVWSTLEPGDTLFRVDAVSVTSNPASPGVRGCVVITSRNVFAFYTTKMAFASFPTYQQFHRSQIVKVEPQGEKLHLRSESGSEYEDNWFLFDSPLQCQSFVETMSADPNAAPAVSPAAAAPTQSGFAAPQAPQGYAPQAPQAPQPPPYGAPQAPQGYVPQAPQAPQAPAYAAPQAPQGYVPQAPQAPQYGAPPAPSPPQYGAPGYAPQAPRLVAWGADGRPYPIRLLEDRGSHCLVQFENGHTEWVERGRITNG